MLFDVQKDQRQGIEQLFDSFHIRVRDQVPIVTMRLAAVKNIPVETLRHDRTCKDSRLGAAPGVSIDIPESSEGNGADHPRNVARSRRFRRATHSGVTGEGDRGNTARPYRGFVAIRRARGFLVDSSCEYSSSRVAARQPNFFVVFPEGALEHAPQFYAMVARVENGGVSASLQRAIVERFPNISVIDLTLVLNTLDSILGRVSAAIRFVALFTIFTGLAVLASAVLSSRSQRVKESILLRTLGAPRWQIVTSVDCRISFPGGDFLHDRCCACDVGELGAELLFFPNGGGHFADSRAHYFGHGHGGDDPRRRLGMLGNLSTFRAGNASSGSLILGLEINVTE